LVICHASVSLGLLKKLREHLRLLISELFVEFVPEFGIESLEECLTFLSNLRVLMPQRGID